MARPSPRNILTASKFVGRKRKFKLRSVYMDLTKKQRDRMDPPPVGKALPGVSLKSALASMSEETQFLVAIGFLLEELRIAGIISERVGVPIFDAKDSSILTEAQNALKSIGKFFKGEDLPDGDFDAARRAIKDVADLFSRCEEEIAKQKEKFTEVALSEFNNCSVEFGCASVSAVRLLMDPVERELLREVVAACVTCLEDVP